MFFFYFFVTFKFSDSHKHTWCAIFDDKMEGALLTALKELCSTAQDCLAKIESIDNASDFDDSADVTKLLR